MALPDPLPDNPSRWGGWKSYNSPNHYDRLCLDFDSNPSVEQIEDNCRRLLVWWQKKLPLKSQPSNPLAQMLRGGLDEAPVLLAEARTKLLEPETRSRLDVELRQGIVAAAVVEFKKILQFVLTDKQLSEDGERRLLEGGRGLGLNEEETRSVIEGELQRLGAVRAKKTPPLVSAPAAAAPSGSSQDDGTKDPSAEFRRLLQMSRLALDGDEMSDDQRDAMCNLGESLGLSGGQAEDLIDEYLEEMLASPPTAIAVKPAVVGVRPLASESTVAKRPVVDVSPLGRSQEKQQHPKFTIWVGAELFLVTCGVFSMGCAGPEATPHERPVTQVTINCFYMAQVPITNLQYELFDPSHRGKRARSADEKHPVISITSHDAEKFCHWLAKKEGKKYRPPTEAEWEYAARGTDGRTFPWGENLAAGHFANFADANTSFPWRNLNIDDGFAETSPVGSYPRGSSPFGILDLAGNVFEWCLDYYESYRGKDITNRRGPTHGNQRVYRGGSWRSKASSLRATARHFNLPDYSSNDVGFRIVCEIEA